MQNFTTKTIREIATEMPATTRIFEEFKIDFCCGGGKNFSEACRFAGVAPEIVSQKIYDVINNPAQNLESPEIMKSPSELIDYILETHHVYTKNEITRLTPLMEKVYRRHRDKHPELDSLRKAFWALCDDLTPHMTREENVLFPFIKHLEMSAANNLASPRPPFRTVKNPVRMMMIEHDEAGTILKRMREITNDYTLPENACVSFELLYHGLEDFEIDLHRHIHLENNVLFPEAVKLEQKVLFGY